MDVGGADLGAGGTTEPADPEEQALEDAFPAVSVEHGTTPDASTLVGKHMLGYQGWFACPDDGTPEGRWLHWFSTSQPGPPRLSFDAWPDMREYPEHVLCEAPLTLADGSSARLFTSYKPATVELHFRWLGEAGLDGVFVQRFMSELLRSPARRQWRNKVTEYVRAGAEAHQRVFAVMYDTSNTDAPTSFPELIADWEHLVDTVGLTDSDRYLRHRGRPLVAIWGARFYRSHRRPRTSARVAELLSPRGRASLPGDGHGGRADTLAHAHRGFEKRPSVGTWCIAPLM